MKQETNWTKVPNELLEALYSVSISRTAMKIFFYLMRWTFGFHRKSFQVSLSKLSKEIGVDKGNLHREIKKLEGINAIGIESGRGRARSIYSIKPLTEWRIGALSLLRKQHDCVVSYTPRRCPRNNPTPSDLKKKNKEREGDFHLKKFDGISKRDRLPSVEEVLSYRDQFGKGG